MINLLKPLQHLQNSKNETARLYIIMTITTSQMASTLFTYKFSFTYWAYANRWSYFQIFDSWTSCGELFSAFLKCHKRAVQGNLLPRRFKHISSHTFSWHFCSVIDFLHCFALYLFLSMQGCNSRVIAEEWISAVTDDSELLAWAWSVW